jgi:hypothetical protein
VVGKWHHRARKVVSVVVLDLSGTRVFVDVVYMRKMGFMLQFSYACYNYDILKQGFIMRRYADTFLA